MLEVGNTAQAADLDAATRLGPSRRNRSGTFHQAASRVRNRSSMVRYTYSELWDVLLDINPLPEKVAIAKKI